MKIKTKKNFKKLVIYSFLFALICLLFTTYANYKIEHSTAEYVTSDVQKLPKTKVAVVLGTAPNLVGGYQNYYFVYRIDAAAELYKSGKVTHFILSGDHGRKNYNEPEMMKLALIEKGVPANVIYLDYAGFRTLDSMIRAKEIFGQNEFIVVSQEFHNQRAVYIARQNGINAYGYNAKDVNKQAGLKTNIREYFARAKVFIDDWFGVNPKFLGEKIEII
ncbi:SanA protein [Algoriella xinjiangensis]|uniref:SanA protein n=1 Tax=Algoriella xinjiangensis TaxID=684065 RepID=A0A1I4Y0I2_9FLAO|nr:MULTISPECIES: ElyC/SanA/YdcF family protein [Algoriella]MBO6212656.1 YdcF family protein [Algoriella sp.]SFN30990.1 SanA protein [Algoriella xinjiangensis]VDH15382.1 vancomycin high temperature exclusion protein [Algoriella xinjiangensis]